LVCDGFLRLARRVHGFPGRQTENAVPGGGTVPGARVLGGMNLEGKRRGAGILRLESPDKAGAVLAAAFLAAATVFKCFFVWIMGVDFFVRFLEPSTRTRSKLLWASVKPSSLSAPF